jgi:hypothetical protein
MVLVNYLCSTFYIKSLPNRRLMWIHLVMCTVHNMWNQWRIQEGGRTRRAPPPKFGKNMVFWCKIVIFHTNYPKNVRASLRSAHLILTAPPPPILKSWIRPWKCIWMMFFLCTIVLLWFMRIKILSCLVKILSYVL